MEVSVISILQLQHPRFLKFRRIGECRPGRNNKILFPTGFTTGRGRIGLSISAGSRRKEDKKRQERDQIEFHILYALSCYAGRRGRCFAETDLIMIRLRFFLSIGLPARSSASFMSALTAGLSRSDAFSRTI